MTAGALAFCLYAYVSCYLLAKGRLSAATVSLFRSIRRAQNEAGRLHSAFPLWRCKLLDRRHVGEVG